MNQTAEKIPAEELFNKAVFPSNHFQIPVSGKRQMNKPKTITKGQLDMIIPSFRKHENSEGVDFNSIFRVFTDKHAKKLHGRQIDVLTKLLAIYHDGVVGCFFKEEALNY